MTDYISRADAIEAVCKLQKYDLDERNRLRIYAPWHRAKRIFVETEAIYKTIYTLPSADIPIGSTNTPTNTPTDLISRADAVGEKENDGFNTCNNNNNNADADYKSHIRLIDIEPSADAYTRITGLMPDAVQGEWIMHIDDLFPCESTQECSVCHAEQPISISDDNYCPNCGARMKGGDDE